MTKVYEALKPLSAEEQQRVLSSALALLGMKVGNQPLSPGGMTPTGEPGLPSAPATRGKGLAELHGEKKPSTNIGRIVLFAYYRDRYERTPTFARGDLRPYFAKAKVSPPANYDRDFSKAVAKGWLHEEGADSYITQKGTELVESGFADERAHDNPRPKASKRRPSKARVR
jgi:hypothetical protein